MMSLVNRYTPILLTIGLVGWLPITIEWSFPYCMSQEDGPMSAVFGMPMPYTSVNGASSLLYDFMPHIFLLNVGVLCLLMFPAIRWLFNRIDSHRLQWLRRLLGVVGSLLLLSFVGFWVLLLSSGLYNPVLTLGNYYRYSELRPVRVHSLFSPSATKSSFEDCTPSRFWFPDGWRHD